MAETRRNPRTWTCEGCGHLIDKHDARFSGEYRCWCGCVVDGDGVPQNAAQASDSDGQGERVVTATEAVVAAEVLQSVEPFMQPTPVRTHGGDCFACASLAMVRHFWPEDATDLTIDNAIAWWAQENGIIANVWDIADRRFRPHREGRPFPLEILSDPFIANTQHGPQSDLVWWPAAWNERTEAYIAAGWVGLASVRLEPRMYGLGDVIEDRAPRRWKHTQDHMVLYDGRRTRFEDGQRVDEMHVVCSAKGAYWIDMRDLLELHGGLGVWWCRPRVERPTSSPALPRPDDQAEGSQYAADGADAE